MAAFPATSRREPRGRSRKSADVRKSLGAEKTPSAKTSSPWGAVREAVAPIAEKVRHAGETAGIRGRTVTLKVNYVDFHQLTRARTEPFQRRSRRATISKISRSPCSRAANTDAGKAWKPSHF